ncbi:30S ribosomal protein S16 [Candidatus Hodgkinia cicadicola]|nr:30S ribosomal protein S16 [Candidatus Hodgkinia cicadicola]
MVKIGLMLACASQNVVVADSGRARNAKAVGKLGMVCVKCDVLCVGGAIIAPRSWLRAGAFPTHAAARLLVNVGLL